jgi:glucoamylase
VRVVVDWDGTVTEVDGLHLVLLEFGDQRVYDDAERRLGRDLTLNEVIAREFSSVLAPLPDVVAWVRENVRIRAGFGELARRFDPLVVSSGFHELIEPVLEREGLALDVRANRLDPRPEGWRALFRSDEPCLVCGEPCKRADVVGLGEIAFVGDGVSDRCLALAATRVFARDGLARYLADEGVPFEAFEDFYDVERALGPAFRQRRARPADLFRRHDEGAPLMATRLGDVLDGTGRRHAFRPAAILGNGSLLVTVSARGELERLFWPNVDHGQHLGELRLGLEVAGELHPLDEAPFTWRQSYEDGTSLLKTVSLDGRGAVEVTDLVTPGEPVLVRAVRSPVEARLVATCRPALDGDLRSVAAYVDPRSGALVFYLRGVALAVTISGEDVVASLREGGDEDTDDVVVHRAPVEGSVSSALTASGTALVLAAFGATPDEAVARLQRPALASFELLASERARYDREAIALARAPSVDLPGLDELYARSLLVLEQLSDRETGAVIAAPEFDPAFEQSGGYGFVWPRDLAYVVLAELAGGRGDLAGPALRWLAREQAPEGLWLQRYWTDGSLAPSWGLHQLDETGVVVFAYEAAWRELGDTALDRELWPSARAAGDFLCGFLDEGTGLPLPSVDLWEQTDGQHSYTAAAVYGGLRACAAMAERHDPALATGYAGAAERVREAIERHLWSEEHGCYLRSRWVARSDDLGDDPPEIFEKRLRYPTRVVRSVDPVDSRVDSSLLGLCWPFRAVEPSSERMQATTAAIVERLQLPDGGVLRHEGDDYAGGNPWLISTLWLGLAKRLAGDGDALRRALAYTISRQTPLGLLPEQVTLDGEPAWVVPLGWSHAMLVLAASDELAIVRDGV